MSTILVREAGRRLSQTFRCTGCEEARTLHLSSRIWCTLQWPPCVPFYILTNYVFNLHPYFSSLAAVITGSIAAGCQPLDDLLAMRSEPFY